MAATVQFIARTRVSLGLPMTQSLCFKYRLSAQSPWRSYNTTEQIELLSRLVFAYRLRDESVSVVLWVYCCDF